ncbi:hypothetical protein JZ751_026389 [Albula glossodonta]|uniref:Uncharacterized protein n=1 Tax=Albula glossodonta TaxID=121402 RepID=A0A8T2PEA1_9TELE|nr:hypothetical protein JZ751_026389 [Albula glossodonta]
MSDNIFSKANEVKRHRNDGEACQRSNCSQDPHVQDKEGDESNQAKKGKELQTESDSQAPH